jgi:hypothetical protein
MWLQHYLLLVLALTSLWPWIHADFRFISYEGESQFRICRQFILRLRHALSMQGHEIVGT